MAVWLNEHQDLRLFVLDRIGSFAPFTREGLLYAIQRRVLELDEDRVHLGALRLPAGGSVLTRMSEEARLCLNRGNFVGRWLGVSGSTPTVMAMWGVRP
jgi:Family of unknown function (DUF6521)